MNCGFLIKLSGNKISFLYNKADKNGLFPFDGNRPVLPLAILRKENELVIGDAALKAHQTGSSDAFVDVLKDAKRPGTFKLSGKDYAYGELLLLAIEKHISEFMQQAYLLQGKTYDDLKPELPIGFLFNDCVTEADQEYVMQSFESHGYGNVSRIDFSPYLFNNFRTPHVLVVSGDGRDISLRLYDREQAKVVQQRLLPGAGIDPRVKAVAELFYNNLTPAGASRDKAMPKLEIEAMEVLERNPAEHESAISIDGMHFEFFTTRREIEIASANIANQSENLGIAEFLHEAGADLGDCSMIVSPELAANTYFRNVLKSTFPEIKFVDASIEKEVLKAIDAAMREGGFNMHKFGDEDNNIASDGPVVKHQTEDGVTILGNKMAKKDIKGEPHSTYIIFNVTVPKGASFVEIRRRDHKAPKEEEKLIVRLAPTYDDADDENRTLVPTEFTDQGLKELTPYRYNFVAVYFNEYGQESHTADLELDYRTVPDVVTNEKPIALLVTNDTEANATLKWTVPKRAKLRVFYSESPFTQKINDVIIDESELPGIDLNVDDAEQQYIVKKDFHGEHFFLPVTIRNGRMVAGDPVCVQSKPQPRDVKAVYVKEDDVVRVEWEWGNLQNVQVTWQYPGDNRTPVDVPLSSEGRIDVAKSPKQSQVIVEVRSTFTSKVDGQQVGSVPVKRTVSIPAANIDLVSVKKIAKGKYSYTLGTLNEVPVPCDLRLLVKEGDADFDNPDKRFDIKREFWQQGKASKQIDFTPRSEYSDIYFRVVSADEASLSRINFVASERTLLAPERTEKPATAKGKDETPTFSDRSVEHEESSSSPKRPADTPISSETGKGNSHTFRNLIIGLLLCVGGYFVYNNFMGTKEPQQEEVVNVDYTSISLNPSDVTLTVDETYSVVVTGEPQDANETFSWESKNTEVATVSAEGIVTAKVAGRVEIVGTTSRSNKTVVLNVRVKAKKASRTSQPQKDEPAVVDKPTPKHEGGFTLEKVKNNSTPQPASTPSESNSSGTGFKLEKIKNQ